MNCEVALGIQSHLFASWKKQYGATGVTSEALLYEFLKHNYTHGHHHSMKWDSYMFILLGFDEPTSLHLHHAFSLLKHHYDPLQFLRKYVASFFVHRRIRFEPPLPFDRWMYDMNHEPYVRRYVSSTSLQRLDLNDKNCLDLTALVPDSGKQAYVLLFHGTDVDSANTICEFGIDPAKGLRNLDFNVKPGFYCTDNLRYVRLVCWDNMVLFNNKAGIVVFACPIEWLHGQLTHLSFHTASTSWSNYVTTRRRNTATSDNNNTCIDAVTGPVCTNGCAVGQGKEEPIADAYMQTCFLSEKAMSELSPKVCGVIYIDIAETQRKTTLLFDDYAAKP